MVATLNKWRNFGFHYWGLIDGAFVGVNTGPTTPRSAVYNSQQYIGLTDANGDELYEGDIVVFKFKTKAHVFEYTGRIIYDQYMWLVEIAGGAVMSINRVYDIRLIGNIYENSDLI